MSILANYSDDDFKRIMAMGGDNYAQHIKEIKEDRDQNLNKYGATKSGTSRADVSIPSSIYWHMVRKYGKDIWKDPKFQKQFRDTFKAFRMWEKW